MSRYIDVDALIDRLKEYNPQSSKVKMAQLVANDMPSIDIAICAECSYWDDSVDGHINVGDHLCRRHMWWTTDLDYCSDAERRE